MDPSTIDGEAGGSEDYEEVYGAASSAGGRGAYQAAQQQQRRGGRTPPDSGYTSGGWSDEEERRPRKRSVARGAAPAASGGRGGSYPSGGWAAAGGQQPQVGGLYRPHQQQYSEEGYEQYNSSYHQAADHDMDVEEEEEAPLPALPRRLPLVKPEVQYEAGEEEQYEGVDQVNQVNEEEDRSSYSFLVAHGRQPRTTGGRPRASHHYAVIDCSELTSGVDRSTPAAPAVPAPEVKPAGSGQRATGSGGSPKVAGGLDALLAAVGMVTDEEEAAAAEEEQKFQASVTAARRLPKELFESEEARAAREHLARAAAAAAEKKAEEQRRRLMAQERAYGARSSSSGRVVSAVHRSPARKSSPAVSLVPTPPGLPAIATQGRRGSGRWGEDSEEGAAQQQQQQQQQFACLPSAGGHAWTPAAARAAAGLGFLQPTLSVPPQAHPASRSPLGRPGGPRPDTPGLEGAGDSGHLAGAPLVPPGGPLEVAVGNPALAAANAAAAAVAAAMAAVSGSRGGGGGGAVSGGSQGSRYLDSPTHHHHAASGEGSRAFWTKEVRPEAELRLRLQC
jgi:hypothetical protein